MLRLLCVAALAHLCLLPATSGAEQQVKLSDSYLPAALQVIAHLVDQMSYDTEPPPGPAPAATSRPTSRPTQAPTSRPTHPPTSRPPPSSPAARPPPPQYAPGASPGQNGAWSISIGVSSTPKPATTEATTPAALETTTPFHRPGLFQAERPPRPDERSALYSLLPVPDYPPLEPDLAPLSPAEPAPRADRPSPLQLEEGELSENHLQYVSPELREMLRLAHDPADERALDERAGAAGGKPKLSQSHLRLLLLHDLLSREAKRLKLHEYGGFSESVVRSLDEAGRGGARAQLRHALARMVERRDSEHDYANNRAKEMTGELLRDDSLLSSELRHLQPLVYHY